MGIKKISGPTGVSNAVAGDWAGLIDILKMNSQLNVGSAKIDNSEAVVLKGAVFYISGDLYIADSDTEITGSVSNYVKITASGDTASAEFVADLSGVTWDADKAGYYDLSGSLYIFDEALAFIDGEVSSIRTKVGKEISESIGQIVNKSSVPQWADAMISGQLVSDFNTFKGF